MSDETTIADPVEVLPATAPAPEALERRDTGTRWRPGQSGNPSGRRKHSVSLSAALKRVVTPEQAEKIARKLLALAADGDPHALRLCFERIDGPSGRPFFNVQIDASDNRTLTVTPETLQAIAESRKRYEQLTNG